MVITHLARHWLARRHYPFPSWLACIARSTRVLMFQRAHRQLLALDIHRRYVALAHDDVYHHLSHRYYLARGMPLRARVRCVLSHYTFEEDAFDADYKQAVYRDGGLLLWQHEDAGSGWRFGIRLEMASRLCAEGDLTIAMSAGGAGAGDIYLHRLSFSWVDGAFAGVGSAVVPFIARNQGHRLEAADAFAAFEQAFPHNSPSFFCFAALQGVAQALGIGEAVAVKSAWQSAYTPAEDRHFANAYDLFWETLGGMAMEGPLWRIALPVQHKPLSEVSSRHRKRAALRREHWQAIGDAARLTLARRRQ
jgi:uncharacterized protein VirK/YbjX